MVAFPACASAAVRSRNRQHPSISGAARFTCNLPRNSPSCSTKWDICLHRRERSRRTSPGHLSAALPRVRVVVLACLAVVLFAFSGCGDSSSGPSEAQLQAAKAEGEEAAREKDRINNLQKQVRSLKHQARQTTTTAAPAAQADSTVSSEPSQTGASSVLRSFHAPSGNVSCEILADGALCSVDSVAMTFAFSDGQPARVESGTTLPRGAGDLAPYGTTVSAGSVTCTVPRSDDPHGITCVDAGSGHGFEASRVASRQNAY
jgi:hypothetical protein